MESISPAAQEDSSEENRSGSVKSDDSRDSSPRRESGRGSPPPDCAICLGTCTNKSFTYSCLHQFCFECLLTWTKVKAECPLCKQNIRSIIHNVRSNDQYEEYMVEERHTGETTGRIDIDNLITATRRTLTLPRSDTIAIQQPPPACRRRPVYTHNLWARPMPDFTGRFRDCTPEFYRYSDSQVHRLVPWINRELNYLLNENVRNIAFVRTRILELLPQYHMSSPEFREAMLRHFGERTDHFLHELYCFASTPYDIVAYDRNVQYTTDRMSVMVNDVISSSESSPPGPTRSPPELSLPGPTRPPPELSPPDLSLPGPTRPPPELSLLGPTWLPPELSLPGPTRSPPELSLPELSLPGPTRPAPELSLPGPTQPAPELSLPGPTRPPPELSQPGLMRPGWSRSTCWRRTVYKHNLWARPMPDFTGRFRDCTPEFYRYNDTQMHRLLPWINRELNYLLNENVGNIAFVRTRILELLPQYHMSSPEFREAMLRHFGERTDHFLHELYCFASTPYDIVAYDRNVQYTTDRMSVMVNDVISSSESSPPGPTRSPPELSLPELSLPGPTRPAPELSLPGPTQPAPELSLPGPTRPPPELSQPGLMRWPPGWSRSTCRRRTVYKHNLWARPMPDFTGRFRDCTPEFYRYNDSQVHRLVPWINRELDYLLNENVGHISFVLTRILELLPQYHISSPEFREAMLRYFGERTDHFLHELYCFASTPYDIVGYDRNVQYTTDRMSVMVTEVFSSSESDANLDLVSSSEPAEPPSGPSAK